MATEKCVKISTYNIYHCADITKIDPALGLSAGYWAFTDTIVNSDNIAEVIFKNGIEICGMQETTAYSSCYGDGDTAQAERIANKLTALTGEKYYWAFAPCRVGGWRMHYHPKSEEMDPKGAFGNSLVSKYPILSMTYHPIGSPQYYRNVMVADLDVNGTVLTVITGHFDNTNADERRMAIEAVTEIKKGIATPTVIMGDFNEAPGNITGTYESLKELYTPTAKTDAELPHTFPSDGPRTTYDYILHTPDIVSRDLHTDPSALCSDHIPLIVTLTLPSAE